MLMSWSLACVRKDKDYKNNLIIVSYIDYTATEHYEQLDPFYVATLTNYTVQQSDWNTARRQHAATLPPFIHSV